MKYDVVVIGGGHAGCEAAHAAARLGASVALIVLKKDAIGAMSCNPAVGGLGKGHLVREIDAMGGLIGVLSDQAGIQFRLLNRRKGPAVRGPRVQTDRQIYSKSMLSLISDNDLISIVEDEVIEFICHDEQICGLELAKAGQILCGSVVVSTGTFLGGIIHRGDERIKAGRVGESGSYQLAQSFENFGFRLQRFKTGTPPRILKKSIDWSVLEEQPGDEEPMFLSYLTDSAALQQVSCFITHTNEKTHDIIKDNLNKSALYGGHISGKGPRYCPSIEDKIARFEDKSSHQIFLEPEGLESEWVYPNGISTSLPFGVQDQYVRSIKGLEKAEIAQYGYAIEYFSIDARDLKSSLESRHIAGLFLAGQICGTTGYEEAAAQGLVSGINAALYCDGREAVRFTRDTSYIGVMIDDLVTRGVEEPYRMFTSRAEYRLSLRADNADQRLTPLAIDLGLVDDHRKKKFETKLAGLGDARSKLLGLSLTSSQAVDLKFQVNSDGRSRTAFELLSYRDVSFTSIQSVWPELNAISREIVEQITIEAKYHVYVQRQRKEVEKLASDMHVKIPDNFSYMQLNGLSMELREKLQSVCPEDLAQAGRIDGMTPAALSYLLAYIKQLQNLKKAH